MAWIPPGYDDTGHCKTCGGGYLHKLGCPKLIQVLVLAVIGYGAAGLFVVAVAPRGKITALDRPVAMVIGTLLVLSLALNLVACQRRRRDRP